MAVIFMDSKYILPKNIIHIAEVYSFTYLLMVKKEKNAMKMIISSIYKDNI